MNSIADFLKRAADRTGFYRDRFEEKKIPTDHSNLVILPFFGDLRSMFLISTLLLQRYREEFKNSKYFILASWPGFEGLFPYVDEYWSLTDEAHIKKFYEQSDGFKNKSDLNTIYVRNLNEFFRDVISPVELEKYYKNKQMSSVLDNLEGIDLNTISPGECSSRRSVLRRSEPYPKRPSPKLAGSPARDVEVTSALQSTRRWPWQRIFSGARAAASPRSRLRPIPITAVAGPLASPATSIRIPPSLRSAS